jgi:predicted ATPase
LELSSFVERQKERAEVKRLLEDTRLLTLTGSGGCGKTRLALAVAGELVDRFEDGVWLVELAPLADPSLVPQAVASTLGVREQPGCSLTETRSDYLGSKKTLLVLDNCEHVA